jgi:hypothetical protein
MDWEARVAQLPWLRDARWEAVPHPTWKGLTFIRMSYEDWQAQIGIHELLLAHAVSAESIIAVTVDRLLYLATEASGYSALSQFEAECDRVLRLVAERLAANARRRAQWTSIADGMTVEFGDESASLCWRCDARPDHGGPTGLCLECIAILRVEARAGV